MTIYQRIYKQYYSSPYVMGLASMLLSIMTSSLLVMFTMGSFIPNILLGLGSLSVLSSIIGALPPRYIYLTTIASLFINTMVFISLI
jgi:hypothetical protein